MKGRLLKSAGTLGASVLIGYLINKKLTEDKSKDHTILEDAGIPDQVEHEDMSQLENAKMVSEGSQYGVQYYNEVKETENYDKQFIFDENLEKNTRE